VTPKRVKVCVNKCKKVRLRTEVAILLEKIKKHYRARACHFEFDACIVALQQKLNSQTSMLIINLNFIS